MEALPLLSPATPSPTTIRPGPGSIRRRVDVRRGLGFVVAVDAASDDPITRELAGSVFPPLGRPAVELIEGLVPEGGRVLDLGANVGVVALAAAATGRRVVAVEAAPRNVDLLEESRRANSFANLRIVHAAVADTAGEVGFIPASSFGYVVPQLDPVGGLNVRAVPVDDLLDEVGWDGVEFLKLDVEGSEVAALIGASRLLRRPDAPPILVESNGHTLHLFGETPTSLKATLAAYGYALFQVERRRLVPVTVEELQPTTVVDYLAIKGAPLSLRRWRIDPPMTRRERLRRVRTSFRSPIEHDRLYIARALRSSPSAFHADRALARPPRPWYALWRR
jgi:FkbM family methyltransferase